MKKQPLHGTTLTAAPDVLADRGEVALRQGRFKEAMEVFKQLARLDPRPEWTHRLADAYAGRAHALADKGMFKEAALVLENTLSAGQTVREPLLYLTCLIRQGQHQRAKQTALKYADQLPAAEAGRVAELAAALTLTVPAQAAVADATPSGAATCVDPSRAAQAVLHAWLQAKPSDEVEALLTRIPLRSPYGPLRLILKSLIMPSEALEKALGLLTMIPAGSMFASARAATEATLVVDPTHLLARWSHLRPAQQAFVAEVRGLPPPGTALLNQILDAERRGPAALFALLVKPGLPLPADELRTACLDLLPAIPHYLQQFDRRFEPLSAVERHRVLALSAEACENWRRAQQHWDAMAEAMSDQQTPDARLARGVVLRHLADLAKEHPDLGGDLWADAITDYLERSLEADPDHLPATLTLLERYRNADSPKDWPKDWHRATDLAAQRFPGNTAILLHAVDAAVARNAYKKAAGFARRLLTLDPINQPVRQRMIELQLAQARKQMRAGRADLAAKALALAAEWERPDAPNAPLRIGQALVTMRGAPNAEAEAGLREAVQLAGGGTSGWFRAVLEAALMGWSEQHRQSLHRELATAQTGEPKRETILSLIGMLGQREIQDSKRVVASVLWRIEPSLTAGSRIAWPAAEFRTIMASLHHLGAIEVLRAYARDAMQRDPEDRTARFYRIVAQVKGNRDHLTDAQETELCDLMDQAGNRQDFHMLNRVQRFLDGPDKVAAGHRLSAHGGPPDLLDAGEMEEILGNAIAGMSGMPDREVRKLVSEFGRSRAIDMLADMMADSPLGEVLSGQQLARLCAAMVGRATEGSAQQARR
jgi:cellulose synthase operon protein C